MVYLKRGSLLLLLLTFPGLLLSKKNPNDYSFLVTSGIWKKYTLDNGNPVYRQTLTYDRIAKPPVPLLKYRSLFLQRGNKKNLGINHLYFDYNPQKFYEKSGSLAIFFGGKSANDVYATIIHFTEQNLYSIELKKYQAKDPKLPKRVPGNYRVKVLKTKPFYIPTKMKRRIHVHRNRFGLSLFFDGSKVFSYRKGKDGPWTFYPKAYIAIGGQGHTFWIDNFVAAKGRNIIVRENFNNPDVLQYRLKVKKVSESSSGGIVEP
jgi:hypothetical protein